MSGAAPGLGLLLRMRLAMLANGARNLRLAGWLKVAGMLGLLCAFLLGEGLLAWWLLRAIRSKEDLSALFVVAIVEKLLSLIFLVSWSMLFFSNVTASLATIYLSRDLDLLLSTPVTVGRVFLLKLIETVLNSSYMVLLFLAPILVALGLAFEAGPPFYLQILPSLLVFVMPPAAAGILLTMLLMRYLPARRTHQALTAVGVILAVSFVTMVRLLAPEKLLRPTTTEDLAAILRALTVPASHYLPSTWAADLALASAHGGWQPAIGLFGRLLALAVASLGLTYLLARRLYFRGVSASHDGGRRGHRRPAELGAPLGSAARDLRLLLRDPTQWSQLLLLLALVIVYVFNITALPQDLLIVGAVVTLRDVVAWVNVGLAGFVLAAVGMRFILPAVSVEGGAFWVIASSPEDRGRYLLRRAAFFLPPMLGFALLLVFLSGRALSVDGFTHLLSLSTAALVTTTLTLLGLGLGAALPAFKLENPAQFILTGGGLLYGLLSLVYVTAVVALEAKPFFWHLLGKLGRLDPELVDPLPYYVMILLLSVAFGLGPFLWGLKRLRRLEL